MVKSMYEIYKNMENQEGKFEFRKIFKYVLL